MNNKNALYRVLPVFLPCCLGLMDFAYHNSILVESYSSSVKFIEDQVTRVPPCVIPPTSEVITPCVGHQRSYASVSWFTCKDVLGVSRLASLSVSLLRSDEELVQAAGTAKAGGEENRVC